jgi:hypothetical protein
VTGTGRQGSVVLDGELDPLRVHTPICCIHTAIPALLL